MLYLLLNHSSWMIAGSVLIASFAAHSADSAPSSIRSLDCPIA